MSRNRPDAATGAEARPGYRGRFAPTPSGPLHRGSLLAALASWLYARAAGGVWLLRIDDLDTARCRAEYVDAILRQLEAHGLTWDGPVRYQSRCVDEYTDALERLRVAGRIYACTCTRAVLARENHPGPDGPVYSGRCRGTGADCGPGARPAALRFRVSAGMLDLDENRSSTQAEPELTRRRDIRTEIGDFVVRRADGIIGYHLACAVDEAAQGITDVVRGSDLLGAAFCHRLLQDALDLSRPSYRHLRLLLDHNGRKLSKQNHASALTVADASLQLHDALGDLGQDPPAALRGEAPPALLARALVHWRPERLPATDIPGHTVRQRGMRKREPESHTRQ